MKKVANVLDNIPRRVSFETKKVVKKYTIETLPNKRVLFNKDKVATMDKKL